MGIENGCVDKAINRDNLVGGGDAIQEVKGAVKGEKEGDQNVIIKDTDRSCFGSVLSGQ